MHGLHFSLSCGRICIGETPKSGITESQTMPIKRVTVHLKIGLENVLNGFENMRVDRGHGQSQVPGDMKDFRSGEDLDKAIREVLEKLLGQEGYLWNESSAEEQQGWNLSPKWINMLPFRNLFPSQSYTESWQGRLEKLFSIPSQGHPSPHWFVPSNQSCQSPFKNIINILSGVGCAHYLQMDASCLVSSHASFGIICQTMLLVPFFLN